MSDLFDTQISYYNSSYAVDSAMQSTQKTTATDNSGFLRTSSTDNLSLDMTDFLSLMVVQLQNQSIDDPADTSDMLNQLVQMSMIQAISAMMENSNLSYAASLVGKEVTIGEQVGGSLVETVGTVTGTGTYNGEQVVFVNGETYPLTSVMTIGKIPDGSETTTSSTAST